MFSKYSKTDPAGTQLRCWPILRPWHDAQAIARHIYQLLRSRKRSLGRAMKRPLYGKAKVKLRGLTSYVQIQISLSRIDFNWFNRIHLLTLLSKFLFLRQILTAATFVTWYSFNHYAIFFWREKKKSCHDRSRDQRIQSPVDDWSNLF